MRSPFTVETFFPPLLFSQYVDPRLDFCANHAHDFPHQYVNFKTNMLSVGYGEVGKGGNFNKCTFRAVALDCVLEPPRLARHYRRCDAVFCPPGKSITFTYKWLPNIRLLATSMVGYITSDYSVKLAYYVYPHLRGTLLGG